MRDGSGRLAGHETVARLIADSGAVRVEGDESVVDLGQRTLNLRTGASIAMSEDREEWARGLAAAYRSPHLWAEIIEDGEPLDDVEIERVELEDPARGFGAGAH
jgi:hypothetical protein